MVRRGWVFFRIGGVLFFLRLGIRFLVVEVVGLSGFLGGVCGFTGILGLGEVCWGFLSVDEFRLVFGGFFR